MEYTTFETQAHNGIVTFPETLQAYGNAKVLVTIIPEANQPTHKTTDIEPFTMAQYLERLKHTTFSVWTDEEIEAWEKDLQHMQQWTLPSW